MTIDRILHLLDISNITAKQLTTDLGLSNSAITDWKKGKAKPSADAIIKIANYFKIPIEYLLELSPFSNWEKVLENLDIVATQIKADFGNSEISEALSMLLDPLDEIGLIKLLNIFIEFIVIDEHKGILSIYYRDLFNTPKSKKFSETEELFMSLFHRLTEFEQGDILGQMKQMVKNHEPNQSNESAS